MPAPRWIAAAALALGLGLGVGSADAQPRRNGPAAPLADRREQIKKRIRALRAYTLTEELALDEQTAGRLFPVLARYDDETDRLLEKRVELQRRLRHADGLRDPRAVDRLIDEAIANQRGFRDLEERRLAELRKFLSPAQTAKLLVVLPALERKIQNQLQAAIAKRRPGAPGQPPSNAAIPAEADDDREPDEPPPAPRPRRETTLRGASPPAPGQAACDPATGVGCR